MSVECRYKVQHGGTCRHPVYWLATRGNAIEYYCTWHKDALSNSGLVFQRYYLAERATPGRRRVYGLESKAPAGAWTTYYTLYPTKAKAEAAAANGRPAGVQWRVVAYQRCAPTQEGQS